MEYRKLGSSELEVSVLSYGTWQLGDKTYWGDSSWEDDAASVQTALDAGINLFDTAEGYGNGASEEALGKALGKRRDDVLISSKVFPEHCQPDLLRQSCEASLQRLGSDHIDLYHIHWPFYDVPIADVWGVLQEFVTEGKVREIALSNYGPQNIAEWFAVGTSVSNQLVYNLLTRCIELEIIPACQEKGMGILAYMPLMQGILAQLWDSIDDIPESRRRTRHFSCERSMVRHGEPGCEVELWAVYREIGRICDGAGLPMADVALAWTLANPAITSVIIGGRRPKQVLRNIKAMDLRLDDSLIAELNAATETIKQTLGTNNDMFCGGTDSRTR